MNYKFLFSIFILSLISQNAYCGGDLYYSFNYNSHEDQAEGSTFSTMKNIIFLGATLGLSQRWSVGQNIIQWNLSQKGNSDSSETTVSLLELGPRANFYFDETHNFYTSFCYNPYVKGSRKSSISNTSEDISGSSFLIILGTQFKASKTLNIGLSINYHSVTISEATNDSIVSEVSQSHNSIYPTINFNLSFK